VDFARVYTAGVCMPSLKGMSKKSKNLTIVLLLFSTLSLAMSLGRYGYVGNMRYLFLNWNLFLAWIPLFLGFLIYLRFQATKRLSHLLVVASLVWLLFFPNTSYVLTDLIHLRQKDLVPIWFDLIMILSFSVTSLYLGIISLLWMQEIITIVKGKIWGWIFSIVILSLSSFGVYLGRFERWNSWDILTSPQGIFLDIFERIKNPLTHPGTIGFTVSFFIFSFLIYVFTYILSGPQVKTPQSYVRVRRK